MAVSFPPLSSKENLQEFKKKINAPIYEVSALNNEGLNDVLKVLEELVKTTENDILFEPEMQESHVLYKFKKEQPFTIVKEKDVYVIKGETVEKIFKMTNFSTEEALLRFSHKLRRLGVDDELEKMGIEEGNIVRILDYEFEYTK